MNKLYGAVLALLLPATAAAAPTIQDFVKHPTYSGVKISPTGEYLAMTVDHGDVDVLAVLRTKDLSLVKVNQLPDQQSVGSFYWTSPERLIFTSHKKFGRYASPFSTGDWFGVNADGSQPRVLVSRMTSGDVTQRGKQTGDQSFSLLDTLRDDDVNVIMTANSPRSSEGVGTELVLVDTISGRRKKLGRAPRENCEIAVDAGKAPRWAVCYDSENAKGEFDQESELYRRGDDGKWTLVNSSKATGTRMSIVGSSKDGRVYATQSDGKAPAAFGVINTQTGQFQELFRDPVSDVSEFIVATDSETVLGVVTEAGAPRVHLVEESHPDAELYASLASAFPGQFVDFSSATKDGRKIIVSVVSDRNPGELYLYDRDTGKARFLMQGRKWLDSKEMASVKPFSFTARDGLKLHGYLTIPNGSDGKNLPMIVNVHGGPMGPRDNWGFNWETQLLAAHGYLVMQVNFRGSGGFGKAFEDMAYGQWADGIMNDVIDATKWTVAQGYANPEKICIYGGSFGGYAAMMAPARDPSLFKCAFGYVGAYDAEVQMKLSDTSDRSSGIAYLKRALGESKTERNETMPINHVEKIKLPVYLAAGARDQRCPPENTERMYNALVKAGNTPEGMLIQPGEMHGFYKEDSNLKLYTEMTKFFARHIGGKVTVGAPSRAE